MQLLATLFNPLQSLVFSDTIPLLCQRSEDTSGRISQTECNLGKTRSSFHSGPLCSGYCGIEEAGGHPHGPPFILGPDTRCVCSPAPRPALLCGGILQSQAPSLSTLSLSAISGQAHFEALFALPEHTWAPSDSLRLQTFTTVIATENLDQCFSQKPNNILREKDVDLERA